MTKCVLAAIAASFIMTGCASAQELSLVGTWTGQRERIAKVEGYRDGLATLVITEQKGRTFKGYESLPQGRRCEGGSVGRLHAKRPPDGRLR